MKPNFATAALTIALSTSTVFAAETVKPVSFRNEGQDLAGELYLPANYKEGQKLPGVVITGAWMTVKDQMPKVYAKEMSRRGYAALIFDFRGWGKSKEGKAPLYMESASMKTSDIKAAAAFLASRPEVLSSVTGFGICASAGYMAKAAAESSSISKLAFVAPWLHDKEIVEQVYGGKAGVDNLIESSKQPQVVLAASKTDHSAIMFDVPYYTEKDRGLIAEWDNKFNTASWKEWLTFDAIAIAKKIRKPTLIIHSESAAIPQGAKAFYKQLKSPKTELWIEGVTQFEFYDRADVVSKAAEAIADMNKLTQAEKLQVKNVVLSVATLADTSNFEALKGLFAPEVTIDYTSLFGGEVEKKSPQTLMEDWAGVLPGFDSTNHAVTDIRVRMEDNRLKATANVRAEHRLGDKFWIVEGSYDYEFLRDGERFVVSKLTFNLAGEAGDRALIAKAADKAKEKKVPFLQRKETRVTVLKFLTSLEKKDMRTFSEVWASDAVQDMPYSPEGFPKRVAGKDNLVKHYSAWPEISGDAEFTDGIVFHDLKDPQLVFVEYKGTVEVLTTGRTYKQTYGGLFHVVEGKIQLFREYYDPTAFAYAFGLDEDGKFN